MKSDSKTKKKDESESPKPKKKSKRRYRNDRSKKWKQSSSEEDSSEENISVSDSSTDNERKKSKTTKRSRSKKTEHKTKRRETSDSSRSPSPEQRKRKKKKSRRSESNSDTEASKKSKKTKKKRKRSDSDSSERSLSRSPVRSRKKSPLKHRKRSRSRSPVHRRSRSPVKRRKRSRTRSRSPKKSHRREKSKSPARNRSESPEVQKKRKPEVKKKVKSSEVEKKVKASEVENKVQVSEVGKKVKTSEVGKKVKTSEVENTAISVAIEKKVKPFEVEKPNKADELQKENKSLQVEVMSKDKLEEHSETSEVKTKKIVDEKDGGKKEVKQKIDHKEKHEEKSIARKGNVKNNTPVDREKEEKMKVDHDNGEPSQVKRKVEKDDKQKAKEREKNEKTKEKEKQKERDKQKERIREKSKREEEKNRRDSKRKEENKDERSRSSGSIKKSPDRKKEISDIEEEMRKRKERIEAWRNARAKKEEPKPESEKLEEPNDVNTQKKWSLEDDEDTDEEANVKNVSENVKPAKSSSSSKIVDEKKKEEEEAAQDSDEADPLEAFMKTIDKEINKNTGNEKSSTKPKATKTKTITVVKTVVKKPTEIKLKPELMEQNQDLMEYSSEEEGPSEVKASDFTEVKKKKELVMADHSKIYYAPFRSNFYVEVPELARMTAEQLKLYRETLGDIQVRGKNVPKPIKTWAQAGLNSKVMNVLKKSGYEKPTPIQAQAIPSVMSGRDMIGIAKTGSGKTLAFVLPMLRHVLDQPELDEDDGPIAIIMTPTRELAIQIYRESKKFCKSLKLSVVCIYGGSGISEQIAELKRGAEIIVCTPGRMIDMLAANSGKVTNCRRCTYLVLDEADRMFDMGFEPQVMRILDNIRPDRQTVLFSATFPRQMEAVARKVLNKPIEVQVGGRSVVCSDVQQNAIVIEADNKFFKLLELLGMFQEKGSVLVFVEKQETADSLFKDLLKKGYPCLSLHGGMDQFDRDSTIADFKNGVTKLMVSTSVAARGLDVKNLILVINFDCPNHYEDYVHRVGRTGRAGNKGTCFTFVTPEQGRNVGDVVRAFELSKCQPPADIMALWNDYKENMEKEGKKVKFNSGFTGKGFKFNDEEDAQINDAKKMRKFTLGLQDSDDEAEAAENAMDKIEADLEKAFSNKPKVALAPEVVEAQKAKAAETNVDKGKLKQAGDIAALINKKLSSGQVIDRNAAATAHIMQGGALDTLKGVGLAKHVIDKLNAKLNYKAAVIENAEPEKTAAVRYEEEIDINDFPQQARWRITSKEIIEQVRELSEAGVTVRGVYIPPNKKPGEDEKRLHLYIESLSERSIQIAKAEIRRLLKEELIRAESHTYRPTQSGRYKVV